MYYFIITTVQFGDIKSSTFSDKINCEQVGSELEEHFENTGVDVTSFKVYEYV